MKRVKLKKRRFEYRPRRKSPERIKLQPQVQPQPRPRQDLDPCDPVVEKLFQDIEIARELERTSWDRLARYLERKGAPPERSTVPT